MSFVFPTHSQTGEIDVDDCSDDSFTSAMSQLTATSRFGPLAHSALFASLPDDPSSDAIGMELPAGSEDGPRNKRRGFFHRRGVSCFPWFQSLRTRRSKANRVAPSRSEMGRTDSAQDQKHFKAIQMNRTGGDGLCRKDVMRWAPANRP